MARLKVTINDELMKKVTDCVKQIWPDEGVRARARFVRDALRRYLRYSKDGRA